VTVVGLDIGGSQCAVVLADFGARVVFRDRIEFDTAPGNGPAYAQGLLFESIDRILASNSLAARDVDSFGVSCGGPLDASRGVILNPPNLPGWIDVPIASMLERRYGRPAFLQNDAKACALAEWKFGAGIGTTDMLFLTMGTGFGCGIICDGRLVMGVRGMAGEVGHIRLADDGPVGFGKAGSVEGFCSGGGIALHARERLTRLAEEGRAPDWAHDALSIAAVDTRLLAGKANSGDPFALDLFDDTGRMLGKALSIFIDTLNPEIIVIGSVFARCESLLRPAMEAEIGREALAASAGACRVVPSRLGESLGDYASVLSGAATILNPEAAK